MKIETKKGGGFVFTFSVDEKPLGIKLLQGLKAEDEETQVAILQAIIDINMAGVAPNDGDTIH